MASPISALRRVCNPAGSSEASESRFATLSRGPRTHRPWDLEDSWPRIIPHGAIAQERRSSRLTSSRRCASRRARHARANHVMLRTMLRALVFVSISTAVAMGCTKPSEPVVAQKPPPQVRNPTGDCVAPPGNGARPGHSHSWRYLPDCQAPLRREYYRVFAWSESVASMFPRPDFAPSTAQICTSEAAGSPLRAVFERYTLCDSQPNIERVNAMKAVDAL